MALREIALLRDGAYRVVQEDGYGAPWVQRYDPEDDWVDAADDPQGQFKVLEQELVAALGALRRERAARARGERLATKLKAEIDTLRETLAGMAEEVAKIKRRIMDRAA